MPSEKEMLGLQTLRKQMDEAYQKALPKQMQIQDAKAAAKSSTKIAAVAGLSTAGVSLPSFDDIVTLRKSVCDAWPEIRATINRALSFASWIPGSKNAIAKVKAWMIAIETVWVPLVCPAPK